MKAVIGVALRDAQRQLRRQYRLVQRFKLGENGPRVWMCGVAVARSEHRLAGVQRSGPQPALDRLNAVGIGEEPVGNGRFELAQLDQKIERGLHPCGARGSLGGMDYAPQRAVALSQRRASSRYTSIDL